MTLITPARRPRADHADRSRDPRVDHAHRSWDRAWTTLLSAEPGVNPSARAIRTGNRSLPRPCIATLLPVHSRPVFADPSGRRRRTMRRIGGVSAAALVICLAAVVVAMAGGPEAPFTEWAAPRAPVAAAHNDRTTGGHDPSPSATSPSSPGPQPGRAISPAPSAGPTPTRSATPRPTASGTQSASVSSGSPVPTNPVGRTPPGHTRSPSPGSSHGL
jgi:hypothetical protein